MTTLIEYKLNPNIFIFSLGYYWPAPIRTIHCAMLSRMSTDTIVSYSTPMPKNYPAISVPKQPAIAVKSSNQTLRILQVLGKTPKPLAMVTMMTTSPIMILMMIRMKRPMTMKCQIHRTEIHQMNWFRLLRKQTGSANMMKHKRQMSPEQSSNWKVQEKTETGHKQKRISAPIQLR